MSARTRHNGKVSKLGAVACLGAAHLDRRGRTFAPAVPGTSNPGSLTDEPGGVARNVAENLHRLGCRVSLCSRVGNDSAGRRILTGSPFDVSLVTVSSTSPTASYTAILDPAGELIIGLADMAIYDELTPEVLAPALSRLEQQCGFWFLDANLPAATLAWLLDHAAATIAVDAISVAKSARLSGLLPRIPYLFCNLAQAASITGQPPFADPCAAARSLLAFGARSGVVTAGSRGIAIYEPSRTVLHLPALDAQPVDVTGAGDALTAATIYGLFVHGRALPDAARLGLAAAAIAVESPHSVSPHLTPEVLHARSH